MPDELTPTPGQEPAPIELASTEMPPTPQPGQEPKAEAFDAGYVQELRREAAKYRKAAQEAEMRLKAEEDAKLSETERLRKQSAELHAALEAERTRSREMAIRVAIEREAHKQGAVDADVIYAVLDRSEITVTDEGAVKGVERAVRALLEAKQFLRQGAPYSGAIPQTPRPSGQQGVSREQVEQEIGRSGLFGRW